MSDDRKAPGQDEELAPDETELAEARELGERLDRALAGERPPCDEALAAALMVRAAQNEVALGPARRGEIVEAALAEAASAQPARRASPRLRRYAPVLALAASLLLVAGSFLTLLAPGRQASSPRIEVPAAQQSRSSDALMGRPFEDRAGASRRLDLVFADRLSGYRQVRFGERSWR